MTDHPIRIGIIGVGAFTLQFHWPKLKEDDRIEVTALCRRNETLLTKASEMTGVTKTYTEWKEMLENEPLEAVLVCTPNYLHAEIAMAALEKGLDVFLEKPIATSTKDAEAVVATANRSKGHLMVGYAFRCSPNWRAVHAAVVEGKIGTIRQVSAIAFTNLIHLYEPKNRPRVFDTWLNDAGDMRPFWENTWAEGNWRSNPKTSGGGPIVDYQTHRIDMLLWCAGSPPRDVSCFLTKNDLPVERAVNIHAVLENGVLFSFSFADRIRAEGPFGRTRFIIAGDDGVIEITEALGSNEYSFELVTGGERTPISSDEKTGGAMGMFIDLIAGDGENPAEPKECVWPVALTEAAYRSASEKSIIRIGE